MADGWSPPDIGQHGPYEFCNNCAGPDSDLADPADVYLLMPPKFCQSNARRTSRHEAEWASHDNEMRNPMGVADG